VNTTGGAIIRRAFKAAGLLGIGQTLGGDYLADGLKELQLLVQQLRLVPTTEYTKTTTVYQLTGVSPVSIGPGATIDVARPVRIERETFTRVDGIDHELDVVDRAAFNAIALKDEGTTWPVAVWFDGGSPTGQLHFWPKSAAELHLVTTPALALFADVTSTHDLPDGYEDMLGMLLAERVAMLYEVTLRPEVQRLARTARRVVERSNLTVPQLDVLPKRVDTKAAFQAG
jgi:hypothetical protein